MFLRPIYPWPGGAPCFEAIGRLGRCDGSDSSRHVGGHAYCVCEEEVRGDGRESAFLRRLHRPRRHTGELVITIFEKVKCNLLSSKHGYCAIVLLDVLKLYFCS